MISMQPATPALPSESAFADLAALLKLVTDPKAADEYATAISAAAQQFKAARDEAEITLGALANLTAEQAAAAADLDRREQALQSALATQAADARQLAADRATYQEKRSVLDTRTAELDQRERDLTRRETALEQQKANLRAAVN